VGTSRNIVFPSEYDAFSSDDVFLPLHPVIINKLVTNKNQPKTFKSFIKSLNSLSFLPRSFNYCTI
jgi:hypothetical protein